MWQIRALHCKVTRSCGIRDAGLSCYGDAVVHFAVVESHRAAQNAA